MHIAYSAIPHTNQPMPADKTAVHTEHSIRLEAYQDTCDKFCKEIIAIQKYIPGWVPAYPVASPQPLSNGEGFKSAT